MLNKTYGIKDLMPKSEHVKEVLWELLISSVIAFLF